MKRTEAVHFKHHLLTVARATDCFQTMGNVLHKRVSTSLFKHKQL